MSGLSTAWLAARRGVDPVHVERRRLDGELYAVRSDSRWVYPAWQFDETGEIRPAVRRLLELVAERRAGSTQLPPCSSGESGSSAAGPSASCC